MKKHNTQKKEHDEPKKKRKILSLKNILLKILKLFHIKYIL